MRDLLFTILLSEHLKENLAAASLSNADLGQLRPGVRCPSPDFFFFSHLASITFGAKAMGPPPATTSVTTVAMSWPQCRLP